MIGPDQRSFTPRSMKGRGLLAILGVSRGFRQTRPRLQDLLYSTRDAEQGAASIRQLLREIRLSLDDCRDVLLTGPGWVGLDEAKVTVDLQARTGPDGRMLEFASDLDIPDPEFEDWLRDTRAHFENRQVENRQIQVAIMPDQPEPPSLAVLPVTANDPNMALFADMMLLEAAVRASDIRPMIVLQPDVLGTADAPHADLALRARAGRTGDRIMLSVTLVHAPTGRTIWGQPFGLQINDTSGQIHRCASDVSLAILNAVEAVDDLERDTMFRVGDIFSYTLSRLDRADAALAQTYDKLRPGVALALRAFIRNTQLLERLTPDPLRTLEEAGEFSRRALELAPNNATVLAAGALVASYRNQTETECRLARQAMLADPLNPLALFAHSQMLSDIEQHGQAAAVARDGMDSALSALSPGPWLLRRSIASLRHGDLVGAQKLFTATHEIAPDNRPALRFLAALRFHSGDREGAHRALLDLKRLEPDFSLDLMASNDYPVHSLRIAGLLGITRSGLI